MLGFSAIGELALQSLRDRFAVATADSSAFLYVEMPLLELVTTERQTIVWAVEIYPQVSPDRLTL